MKKQFLSVFLALSVILGCIGGMAYADSSRTPTTELYTKEGFFAYIMDIVKKEGNGSTICSVDDDVIKIVFFSEKSNEVLLAAKTDYSLYAKQWENICANPKELTKATYELACDLGHNDILCVFSIVNCDNKNEIYYSACNGKTIFNVLANSSGMQTDETNDNIEFYQPDTYKVGADLPAGEYYFVPLNSEKKVYVCVTGDSNGKDILENSYNEGSHYITVSDGQYLEVSNAKFCPSSEYPANPVDIISASGMYLVGKDIVAGEYKLSAEASSKGYYCLYQTSDVDRDILSNDYFESSSYVTVANGQYLEISKCTGSLVP